MKIFTALALLACAAMVAADVSHLARSYLPPTKHSHNNHAAASPSGRSTTTTVIEKQELQELPEQIEYLPAEMQMVYQDEDVMPQMPQMQYLPPLQRQQQAAVMPPAMNYLPPSEHSQPSRQYLSPLAQMDEMKEMQEMQEMQRVEEMPSYQHQHHDLADQQKPPRDQYLPPAHRSDVPPTYQAYQAQMQEQQLMQKMQSETEPETEPAHILANDGYHYKSGASRRLFRSRH